jgi:hypothetical protein
MLVQLVTVIVTILYQFVFLFSACTTVHSE